MQTLNVKGITTIAHAEIMNTFWDWMHSWLSVEDLHLHDEEAREWSNHVTLRASVVVEQIMWSFNYKIGV